MGYSLTWDGNAYADTYIIKIGTQEVRVNENKFEISRDSEYWRDNDTLAITIQSFDSNADYLISNNSNEIVLSSVYSLTVDNSIDNVGLTLIDGDVYVPQVFTVSFDLNDGSGIVSSQGITTTVGLEYPAIPTRTGYIFRGWYIDSACMQLFDFSQTVTGDVTVFAGWQACSVTGNLVETIDITKGYNSESTQYMKNTANTSTNNHNYVYFTALTTGSYTFYYKSDMGSKNSSIYKEYFYVRNVTRNSDVLTNKEMVSTSWQSVTFEAQAGDVFYVRVYAWKKNSYNYSTYRFYITGARTPNDGGVADDCYYVPSAQSDLSYVLINEGSNITITATKVDNRYLFAGWYNGETCLSSEYTYSFTMPSENITYTAKWHYFSVTTKKSIEAAGTISEYTDVPIQIGEEITINATTNDGYTWLGWYDGESLLTNELSYMFVMAGNSVTYTAKWIECPVALEKVVKTEKSDEAGAVLGVSGATKVGEQVTITATTNNGYTWLGWYDAEGNNVSNGTATYTFVMPIDSTVYTAKWTYYTVTTATKEASGGTYTAKNAEKITVGEEVSLSATTNNGYTWLGWYNGQTVVTNDLDYTFTMPAADVTYSAKWIECPVVLTKVVKTTESDEAGTVFGLSGATKVGEQVTISATTNDGYTWLGWYDPEGNNVSNGEATFSFVMPTDSTVYTAKWTYYTVTTTTNETSGGTYIVKNAEKVTVGEGVALSATTNSGYMWMGWYKNTDAEPCSNALNYSFTMLAEDVTYTAKWMVCPVTVTQNIEEAGSISGLNSTTALGDRITLTATTNTGYTWKGWFFDGSDEPFTTELQCAINLTTTTTVITAKWACYTFTAEASDSAAGSVTRYCSEKITAGESVTVIAVTNDGYTFKGWYDGEELLANDAEYTFTMPSESIIYTAEWDIYTLTVSTVGDGGIVTCLSSTLTPFTVSFDLNGATGTAPARQIITETNALSYPEIPTRNGYVFAGWYTNVNCTGDPYDFSALVNNNITLYAKWIAHTGNDILPLNGCLSVSVVSKTSSTKSYYAFVPLVSGSISVYSDGGLSDTYGYLYDSNKSQIAYNDDDGDGNNFKITYDVIAGTLYYVGPYGYNSSGSTTVYLIGNMPTAGGELGRTPIDCSTPIKITAGENFTIFAKTENGYTFLGWFRNDETTAFTTDLDCTFTMPKENIVFTAKWTSYTFTAERNDISAGTVTEYTDKKITKGSTVSVAAVSNAGYTWLGWYNGDTLLTEEETYTFTMPSANIVYTAKWGCYTLTTTANLSGAGSATVYTDEKIVAGQLIELRSSTNTGYTWLGWYNGDELLSSNADYSFMMPYERVVYTAKWAYYTLTVNATEGGIVDNVRNSAVVSFDLNDSTGIYTTQTITANQGLTYPSIPTRDGYVFRGWFTDADCTNLFDFSVGISKDVTVYAGWQAMVTTGYSSREIFITKMSSSGNYPVKSISTDSTSQANCKYTYFTALKSGTYEIKYCNSSSTTNYGTYVYIYNATTGAVIKSNTNVTSTSYVTVTFTATAGDVIYVRNYRYNTNYSSTFTFYVIDCGTPQAGGKFDGVNANVNTDGLGVAAGESVTVTAQTKPGYIWQGWFDGETLVSSDISYTFEMPYESVVYTAKWIYYSITTEKNIDAAGTINEMNSVPTMTGDEVRIMAISNYGYIWQGWYEGDTLISLNMNYTFAMPPRSVVYTAKWTYYSITTEKNIAVAGNITERANEPVAVGDEVTISAVTNDGYTFLGWYNGEEQLTTELTYTFMMTNESVTYTAKWSYASLTIHYIVNGSEVYSQTYTLESPLNSLYNYSGSNFAGWYSFESFNTNSSKVTSTTGLNIVNNNTYVYGGTYIGTAGLMFVRSGNDYAVSGYTGSSTAISLPSTFNGCDVTSISAGAFRNNRNIKSITIPTTIETIAAGAFGGCTNLESMAIPFVGGSKNTTSASTSTLFGYIFGTTNYDGAVLVAQDYSGSSSMSYYIPAGLHTVVITGGHILRGAFQNCNTIKNITIGNAITEIGYAAFENCTNLETVSIGSGVQTIDWYAFSGCTKLYIVVIPNNVTSISWYAFRNCTGLLSITIGSGVTGIGTYAFQGCDKLIEVVNLSSLNITAGSETWGYVAYSAKWVSSSNYIFVTSNGYIGSSRTASTTGTGMLLGYIGKETQLVLPTKLNSYSYSTIYKRAFYNNKEIQSITISSGITTIEESAFYGCGSLGTISIPTSVNSIGRLALEGTLWYNNQPNGVVYVNTILYKYKGTMPASANIAIRSGTTIINDYAFEGCYQMVGITIPDTVTTIRGYALKGCSGLKTMSIPSTVTYVGEGALSGCTGLTNLVLPFVGRSPNLTNSAIMTGAGQLGYIFGRVQYSNSVGVACGWSGYDGFYIPTSLNNVTILAGKIGPSAFLGCSMLTSIILGDGVTEIQYGVFSGCGGLTNLVLPFIGVTKESATVNDEQQYPFGYFFERGSRTAGSKAGYTSVLQKIESTEYTCYIPTTLTNVTINGGCIFANAFKGCTMITTVTIGADVTYIGANAFSGCDNLTSVVFENTSGWKRYSSKTATSGTALTLTNTANAAKYLTTTYASYYWKRG